MTKKTNDPRLEKILDLIRTTCLGQEDPWAAARAVLKAIAKDAGIRIQILEDDPYDRLLDAIGLAFVTIDEASTEGVPDSEIRELLDEVAVDLALYREIYCGRFPRPDGCRPRASRGEARL